MLLVAAMLLTASPASVLASSIEISGDNISTPGTIDVTATDFTVDTNGTTEVLRVAAGPVGNLDFKKDGKSVIVPQATPSGMPKMPESATFPLIAYAGETPEQAQVQINISSKTKPGDEVNIHSTLDQNLVLTDSDSWTSVDDPNKPGYKIYTRKWTVSSGVATAGDNVYYDITYSINGRTYHTYAASHVEYITRPTGSVLVVLRNAYRGGYGRYWTRASGVFAFQSKNMYTVAPDLSSTAYSRLYTGWGASTTSDIGQGYINYAAGEAMEEGNRAIRGLGSSGSSSLSAGGYAVADTTYGSMRLCYNGQDGTSDAMHSDNVWSQDFGERRPYAFIFLDTAEGETLRSLNMRMTFQMGDGGNKYRNLALNTSNSDAYCAITGIGVYGDNQKSHPGNMSDSGSGKSFDTPMPTGDAVMLVDTTNVGRAHELKVAGSTNDVKDGGYRTFEFSGSGASSSATEVYTVGVEMNGYQVASGTDTTAKYVTGAIAAASFSFVKYDTSALRALINAVNNNTGVDGVFKGVNPQSTYYTSGWTDFLNAYETALGVIAAPDPADRTKTKQAEIDAAVTALKNAYKGLSAPKTQVNYSVKYVLKSDNSVNLVEPKTGTVAVGSKFVSTAPVIIGYELNDAQPTRTVYVEPDTADINIVYEYNPQQYSVILYTNNDKGDTEPISLKFNDEIPTSFEALESYLGTKKFYTFKGVYYDFGLTNPVNSGDRVPYCAEGTMNIYAKWEPTPLNIKFVPKIEGQSERNLGTVVPSAAGTPFARPAEDIEISGYKFVDYYDDEALTKVTTWPVSLKIGDGDKTIYGRYEDVKGKISFEPNGGSAVESIEFRQNNPVSQPSAPTKEGYEFAGWFYDRELTQPITGWTKWTGEKYLPDNQTITVTTAEGFVAYAKWNALNWTISFDVGHKDSSFFNTKNADLVSITGPADGAISAEDLASVVIPNRFNWKFSHWELDGVGYDLTNYPTKDITLKAAWEPIDKSAFIDLTAYKMLSGEASNTLEALKGDVITIRMTSRTNFYTGSSLFVFMYDKNFYELVNEGASAFKLNPDNDYIKGLGVLNAETPTYTAVTDSSLLEARWPEAIEDAKSDYSAIQIAIDPNITEDNYKTKAMKDESWLVEFKLKIKDDATGSGRVYMDNAWTRTEENPLGLMFYGWTKNADNVWNTTNNVVVPELTYAYAEVTVDESTQPVYTTVTAQANGGKFPDNTEEFTFMGRAETEILTYPGTPVLKGYHLDKGEEFVNVNDDSDFWIEGYCPTVEKDGVVYKANWKANQWSAKFYKEPTDETPVKTYTVDYNGTLSVADPTYSKTGYTPNGWKDEDGNVIDFENYHFLDDSDVSFYVNWVPAPVNYTINYIYNDGQNEVAAGTRLVKNGANTEDTIKVVASIPGTPEAKTTYILESALKEGELAPNTGYGYDPTQNPNPSTVATADGKAVLTLYCKTVPVEEKFVAGMGHFEDGGTEKSYFGEIGKPLTDTVEEPTRTGYNFTGYKSGSKTWSVETPVEGKTWTAQWEAKSFKVYFITEPGAQAVERTVAFDAAISSAPTVYSAEGCTFVGWSLTGHDDYSGAISALLLKSKILDTEGDRTYYAVQKPDDFTVTYTVDGETYGTPADYAYGSKHNFIAKPGDKTGYDFKGWYLNGDETTEYAATDEYTVPASALTISGKYVAKEYNVIFDANGGSYLAGDGIVPTKFNSAITAPLANPVRSGYEFKGWSLSDDNDQTKMISNFGKLATEGAKYYAVWEAKENKYHVEILLQTVDGSGYERYGELIELTGNVEESVEYTSAQDNIPGFTLVADNTERKGVIPAPDAETQLLLKVKYTRNQYNIKTIAVEGADAETAATYYYDAPITAPTAPDANLKPGYTFEYWYEFGKDENVPYKFEKMPDSDITLVAKWKENKYPVNFYLTQADFDESKTPFNSSSSDYGSVILPATGASRTGYTFKGWAKAGETATVDFNNEPKPTVPIDGISYVGIWEVNTHFLSFKDFYGKVVGDPQPVAYGTAKKDFPAPPTLDPVEGYKFKEWNYGSIETMPDDDYIVTSIWDKESYTINFDLVGGTVAGAATVDSITGSKGDDISPYLPSETPKKTGYTFEGWTLDGIKKEDLPEIMPDLGDDKASVTYKAMWTINEYTITYKGYNGVVLGTIKGDYNTEVDKSKIPVAPDNIDGYYYDGWSIETPDNFPAENLTITAKYEPEVYTLTIDANNGLFGDKDKVVFENYKYGDPITAPDAPKREGYTFDGYIDAEEQAYTIPETMPDLGDNGASVTVKAKWNINSYTIYYKGLNGKDLGSITKNYGATIEVSDVPTAPEEKGYTFTGWSESTPGAMPAIGEISGATKTITANYDIQQHTVTISADGGKLENGEAQWSITDDYGTVIYPPDGTPSKEGHEFAGWSDTIPGTIPEEDIEITALWDVLNYKMKFNPVDGEFSKGDSAIKEVSYAYGVKTAAYETEPTMEGYTFKYWYEGEDSSKPYDFENTTMPSHDVTLKAHYEVNEYTITFVTGEGAKKVNPVTKKFNEAISAPKYEEDPATYGYTFKYWYEGEDSSKQYNFITMPAHDLVLTAYYEANPYKVQFCDEEGNVISETPYDYGTKASEIVLPTEELNPTKQYYTLDGWTVNKESEEKFDFASEANTVGISGYTFYPVFKKIPVELVAAKDSTAVIETMELPEVGIIYGLDYSLSEEELLERLAIEGSGRIEVTPSLVVSASRRICGTGTVIDLYDIENGEVPVAKYQLVIFGDVNGDGIANANDLAIAKREFNAETKVWSDKDIETYAMASLIAIDFNNNWKIEKEELDILAKVALNLASYDQTKVGELEK